jgi:hephaestin
VPYPRSRRALVPTLGLATVAAGGLAGWLMLPAAPAGRTITHYVAAEEVEWDYAPAGRDLIHDRPFDAVARRFVEPGPRSIGRVYLKALYREYTDSTFGELKPRAPEWEHLGFLGPLLRAEVGDTIRVVFRNRTRHPASMHPHGVFYEKSSEGAPSADGSSAADRADDGVPPGGTHVYVWPVPERAGPSHGEPSSSFWMYHSHANETGDVNAGLLGPMIVTRRGAARADGTPADVDRELVVAFAEVDENESTYLPENLKRYPKETKVMIDTVFGTRTLGPLGPNNFKETMNGFLYGNLQGLTTRVGERVRWYVMSSTNFEFHAPHWHGNTVVANHMRTDVAGLLPMGMLVADMTPDNPGTWLFHCHVGAHLAMGMQAQYRVEAGAGRVVAHR